MLNLFKKKSTELTEAFKLDDLDKFISSGYEAVTSYKLLKQYINERTGPIVIVPLPSDSFVKINYTHYGHSYKVLGITDLPLLTKDKDKDKSTINDKLSNDPKVSTGNPILFKELNVEIPEDALNRPIWSNKFNIDLNVLGKYNIYLKLNVDTTSYFYLANAPSSISLDGTDGNKDYKYHKFNDILRKTLGLLKLHKDENGEVKDVEFFLILIRSTLKINDKIRIPDTDTDGIVIRVVELKQICANQTHRETGTGHAAVTDTPYATFNSRVTNSSCTSYVKNINPNARTIVKKKDYNIPKDATELYFISDIDDENKKVVYITSNSPFEFDKIKFVSIRANKILGGGRRKSRRNNRRIRKSRKLRR